MSLFTLTDIKKQGSIPDNSIVHADCLDAIKHIPDGSVGLLLADPPYDLYGKTAKPIKLKNHKSIINYEPKTWDRLDPTLYVSEFARVCEPTGNILIFTAHNLFGVWYELLEQYFNKTHFIVWHKTNPAPQVRKHTYLSSCELIIRAFNKGNTFNFTTQNDMHNMIQTPYCMGKERTGHETQKPLRPIKKLIEVNSNPGDLVLDPFAGSFTTAEACILTDRRFICIEKEEKYVDIGVKRIGRITHVQNGLF